MKITKYEHACFVIEDGGQRLVVDPGEFSKSLPKNLTNVVGIVITHVHQDHFSEEIVRAIIKSNPDVKIFTTEEVRAVLNSRNVQAVTDKDTAKAGSFTLAFFGTQHAVVDPEQPIAQNVGVYINDSVYYPGDSFTYSAQPVKVLALPTSGPWLKTSESLNFLKQVKPELAFPTHESMLSAVGLALTNSWLERAAQKIGTNYQVVSVGKSIDI
jgi:L-ascorbate metabolism protein UlaG (beta-lactamase superfamily)